MTENAVSEQTGFGSTAAAHFSRLTQRNGISLMGLSRNPRDLEVFFQTALFFISEAGTKAELGRDAFTAALDFFLRRHARWLSAGMHEVLEMLSVCGLIVADSSGTVRFAVPASHFDSLEAVETYWDELETARLARRRRVQAELQAKNRAVNAPKKLPEDPQEDERLMLEALAMARKAYDEGEVPVGAVLVIDGNIVSAAGNEVISRHDPTAHAEIVCIRKAVRMLGNERLNGAVLYVTLEPCAMCACAISYARIARVVWGADDPASGGMRGALDVADKAHLNHRPQTTYGVLRSDCERILNEFFKQKRGSKSELMRCAAQGSPQ